MKRLFISLLSTAAFIGCTSISPPAEENCALYTDLGVVRANPAGALDRHLAVEANFKVCPTQEGLAEIRRKHIELKHEMLALLSRKTEEELNHPLRVERLQTELLDLANQKIMKKGRVVQVLITRFELE